MLRKLFISDRNNRANRPLIALVVVALVLIIAGLALSYALNQNDGPVVINETTSLPAPTQTPPSTVDDSAQSSAPATAVDSPTQADIVRISVSGDMLVAGKSTAGASIAMLLDEKEIGKTTADDNGEWVFIGKTSLSPGEHYLDFITEIDDKRYVSADDILILIPAEPVTLSDGDSPPKPYIALLPSDPDRAARLLQRALPPDSRAPVGPHFTVDTLELHAVSGFKASGTVQAEEATLLVYIDNSIVGGTTIQGQGASPVAWEFGSQLALSPTDTYTVRVDMQVNGAVVLRRLLQFDPAGSSLSRIEIDKNGKRIIRVQKGDTLWRIAVNELGKGHRFLAIMRANPGQISNPDLIYPNQVFELPDDATIQAIDRENRRRLKTLSNKKPDPKALDQKETDEQKGTSDQDDSNDQAPVPKQSSAS